MQYIPAKTIVTKIKPSPFWFETDYNMNIYRGCCHGCIYCDSRSDCYHIDDFDTVRAKKDAIKIIAKDLGGKRKKGIVATGSMSDPYNPFEKELKLTRQALELIDQNKFGLAVATKSSLITRDTDIIKRITSHSNAIVKITITTADDKLGEIIEPAASLSSERFAAVRHLTDEGIFAGILLMPLLPFINDSVENVTQIVRKAHESGAKFIYFAPGVTMRANQRDYFYDKISTLFPGVKEKYIRTFADKYSCESPDSKKLYEAFKHECKKYGILYDMRDIIKSYKKISPPQQLSLF